MGTTSINIRMDEDLKKQFEYFCNDMGMSMSTAFTIFAKKTVREYRIPFEVGANLPHGQSRDIEHLLDEADQRAEQSDVRYTGEEVFGRIRRGIHEQKVL